MKNTKKEKSLSIEDFSKIESIFAVKKWPISSEMDENFFNLFCKMLSPMAPEEIGLILELTKDFLWISESDYIRLFRKSFELLLDTLKLHEIKDIVLCPLLPECAFQKCKSSIFLLYLIKSNLHSLRRIYSQINISIIDSPSLYNPEKYSKKHTLCLVDDFIGTGTTVIDSVDFFINKKINKETISILSLVAMRKGIDFLSHNGYNTFVGVIRDKGIDGTENAEIKYRIMKEIEARISVPPKFSLGFEQSEALVRMIRTPNNTFPIYWLRNSKNPYAPFQR